MERSDVFLSYRRADVEFTKRLYEKLKATDRAVWVDWENLPPGVEGFSDEIQRGIEGTNAFLCILSPSYLESEYCLMELREALKLKKRVIPIVLKKFDPLPPPEGIGHINWVYFTPHAGQRNKFEDSFPKVIKALEADYEHAREHTRLLLRAIDWEKNEKNTSYLLKDAEIEKAERWQLAAIGKNPAPTELQGEYILASRAYQRKYQRRLTTVFGILLVVAVLAAIMAGFQWRSAVRSEQTAVAEKNNAIAQESTAQAERATAQAAEATAVVAQKEAETQEKRALNEAQNALISGLAAQSQLTQSRQLGILLALEAYKRSEEKGEFNPAVETSLRGTLVDFTGLPVHSYRTGATFVRFSQNEDQAWLISASQNGMVQLSDLTKGLDSEPIVLMERGLENIVLSPDGQWLAGTLGGFEIGEQEVRLWDLNDPQADPILLELPAGAGGVITLSFSSPNSSRYWLAAGLNDGSVHRWDLRDLPQVDHEELYRLPSGRGVTAIAFSPNGFWMAVAFSSSPSGDSPLINIWELQNLAGEPEQIDLRGVTVTRLEFNTSGKWLAGASDDGDELSLWNMLVGSTPSPQPLDVEGVNDIAFSPDERWVAVAQDSKVEVWDTKRLFEDGMDLPGYKDPVLTVAFSQDSRQLATGDLDGQIHLWNTADFSDDDAPEESEARVYNSFDVFVSSVAFNSDSSRLAAAGDEQVRVWSFPETLSAPVRIANPLNPSTLENALLIQPSSDRLFAMDLTGQDPVIVLETEQSGGLDYQVSPDQRYLAVISNRKIEVWDLENPTAPILPTTEQEGRVVAPTFTADSHWFVYAVYDDIFALDLQAPESAVQLTGNRNGSPVSEFFTVDNWLFSKSTSEVLAWNTSAPSLSAPTKVSTSVGVPLVYSLGEESTWIFVQQSSILSAWDMAESTVDPVGFEGKFQEVIDERWLIITSDDNQLSLRDLSKPDSAPVEFPHYQLSESRRWLYYHEEGVLQLLDLESPNPQPVAMEGLPGSVPSFSPNDEWLAIPSQEGEAVALYDLANDLRGFELSGYESYLFSPDGHWLVTTSEEGDVFFLYNLTGDPPAMAQQFDEVPFSFSPNGGWLVTTALEGNSVVLYELTEDVLKLEVSDHQPLSFSLDDHWLILRANENGEQNALYDLEKREIFHETYPPTELLETSPDGRWLYGILEGGSRTEALLIDLNNPENFYPLTGHTDELIGMDFTADGRSLLTYGHDRTIRIWDLEHPAADPVVLPHEEAVHAVDFTENGEWLISETLDGIYIWPWKIKDVQALACRLVGRNLTPEEWNQYVSRTDPLVPTCVE